MSGWPLRYLSSVASVFNGKTPSKADQRNEGHPVLKIKDVSADGKFRGKFESFVENSFSSRYATKFLQGGDSLILNAAHNASHVASKTYFAEPEVFGSLITGEWLVIRPCSSIVNPRFVYHWLSLPRTRSDLRELINGIHLYPKDVSLLKIPIPPLTQQHRIVEVLDQAGALLVNRRQSIGLLESLAKSIFLDMFGDPSENPKKWPTGNLGEIITTGPQNGLYKPASEYGSGVPIVRIDSFHAGVIPDLSTLKHLRISGDELVRWELRTGDLLINRVNSLEYLGKSALVPTLTESTVYESNMMRFAVDRNIIDPEFLIQVLQSADIKRQILSSAKNAVNQSSINQRDVRALRVILPPLRVQREFLCEMKARGHVLHIAREQLCELGELFESLQARAFNGEL